MRPTAPPILLRCSACGFAVGDPVKMKSGIVKTDGSSIGEVHGVVEAWHASCGHIVMWHETGCATALPNENVQRDS